MKEVHTNEILSDILEMHFLEIPKFDETKGWNKENLLEDWIAFLKNPESPVVKMVSEYVKEIEKTKQVLYGASVDTKIREFYESRMKGLRVHISSLSHAKREGLKEGVLKGKQEFKQEDALKIDTMKHAG